MMIMHDVLPQMLIPVLGGIKKTSQKVVNTLDLLGAVGIQGWAVKLFVEKTSMRSPEVTVWHHDKHPVPADPAKTFISTLVTIGRKRRTAH